MKQYVVCKGEAERDQLLRDIEAIGITWADGDNATNKDGLDYPGLSIGLDHVDGGITGNWPDDAGKQTTIPRFLIGLKIEKLKRERKALPKLGEE